VPWGDLKLAALASGNLQMESISIQMEERAMYQPMLSGFEGVSLPSLKVLRERPGDRVLTGTTEPTLLDLVSAVIGDPDTALRVLGKFATLAELSRVSPADLQRVKGVGKKNAARLKAAIELGRRSLSSSDERPQIKSPADAANLLMGEMGLLEQEVMRVILLDTRNRVHGIYTVYQGSLNTTMVRICEVFREAIRNNSAAIIVAHNHPSNDPSASPEDVAITLNLVQAGKLMDIAVLDHLIVCRSAFLSMRERGLGFDK
jgi:DNA repair protein RadC